jgi:hypothetical protein
MQQVQLREISQHASLDNTATAESTLVVYCQHSSLLLRATLQHDIESHLYSALAWLIAAHILNCVLCMFFLIITAAVMDESQQWYSQSQ